jgi:Arc/MetJ-type ribon-helix-helix transcriptional regulator
VTDGRVGESSQSFKVVLPDVNVPLSEHWQRFVAEQVRSGRFPSEAAILEEALALL